MEKKKVNAKDSKCFTCKFGLCMVQENTAFLEVEGVNTDGQPPQQNTSLGWDDEPEVNLPKQIVETRTCSTCFWSPAGFKMDSPVVNLASVKECSRYEKRD